MGLVLFKKQLLRLKNMQGQTLHMSIMPGSIRVKNLLSNFEKQTGCKVVMDLFDSNEQMYIKVANGEAYDAFNSK